jgi:hypothetical protein
MKQCIGLFGTCGSSKWRDGIIKDFKKEGINYFNPLVKNWTSENAGIETIHLAEDSILLFSITSETYGVASLAEVGYAILRAVLAHDRRDIIVMIDMKLSKELMANKDRAKESLRLRTLVLTHLKMQELSNIYLVDNLDDMALIAKNIYKSNILRNKTASFSIKNYNNKKKGW